MLQLANQGPPAGWTPPTYNVLSWDDLTETERSFMLLMLDISKGYGRHGTRVYLHGSRAKGVATADSDYDILTIFPDHVLNLWPGQAMGRMDEVAKSHGAKVSPYWVYQTVWDDPSTTEDPTFLEQVKKYGIEVPGSG